MARITDENKMKLVKQTLLDIIVRDGSSHASISKMAKEAGVSAGYLYRYYESKESLLLDLYKEKFEQVHTILLHSIQDSPNLEQFILTFHHQLVNLSKTNENEVLFLLKMMTDYAIKLTVDMKSQLAEAVKLIKDNYRSELNKDITAEQIFTQVLGSMLLFINMRKRGLFKVEIIDDREINDFSQMIIKTLR